MTITRFVACSSILAMTLPAGSAREKEEAFQAVQQSVRERTGKLFAGKRIRRRMSKLGKMCACFFESH
jgi:hypothetical protein